MSSCKLSIDGILFPSIKEAVEYQNTKLYEKVKSEQLGKKLNSDDIYRLAKKLLPDLKSKDLVFVNSMVMESLSGNKSLLGRYQKGVVYLLENSDKTIHEQILKHEIFHKIFNEYLTEKERKMLYNAFSKEYGVTSIIEFEEHLAHAFQIRDVKKSNVIVSIFNKILRLLNLIRVNTSNIDSFFKQIEEGQFRVKTIDNTETIGSRNYSEIQRRFKNFDTFARINKQFLENNVQFSNEGLTKVKKIYTLQEEFIKNNIKEKLTNGKNLNSLKQTRISSDTYDDLFTDELKTKYHEYLRSDYAIKKAENPELTYQEYESTYAIVSNTYNYVITNKDEIKDEIFAIQNKLRNKFNNDIKDLQSEKLKQENNPDLTVEEKEKILLKIDTEIASATIASKDAYLYVKHYPYLYSLHYPGRLSKKQLTTSSYSIHDDEASHTIDEGLPIPEEENKLLEKSNQFNQDTDTYNSQSKTADQIKDLFSTIKDPVNKNQFVPYGVAYITAVKMFENIPNNVYIHKLENYLQKNSRVKNKELQASVLDIIKKIRDDAFEQNVEDINKINKSNVTIVNLDKSNETIIFIPGEYSAKNLETLEDLTTLKIKGIQFYAIKKNKNESTFNFYIRSQNLLKNYIEKYNKENVEKADIENVTYSDLNASRLQKHSIVLFRELIQNMTSQGYVNRMQGEINKDISTDYSYKNLKTRKGSAQLSSSVEYAIINKFQTKEDVEKFLNKKILINKKQITFRDAFELPNEYYNEVIRDFLNYIGISSSVLDHVNKDISNSDGFINLRYFFKGDIVNGQVKTQAKVDKVLSTTKLEDSEDVTENNEFVQNTVNSTIKDALELEGQSMLNDLSEFLLTGIIHEESTTTKKAGGKKIYDFQITSNGLNILNFVSDENTKTRNDIKTFDQFDFLKTPLYKHNIFNPNVLGKDNNLYRVIEHDAISISTSYGLSEKIIEYTDEKYNDFYSRIINFGFMSSLAKNKQGNYKYIQYTPIISNRPKTIGVEVDLLTGDKLKSATHKLLLGIANRPELTNIKGYDRHSATNNKLIRDSLLAIQEEFKDLVLTRKVKIKEKDTDVDIINLDAYRIKNNDKGQEDYVLNSKLLNAFEKEFNKQLVKHAENLSKILINNDFEFATKSENSDAKGYKEKVSVSLLPKIAATLKSAGVIDLTLLKSLGFTSVDDYIEKLTKSQISSGKNNESYKDLFTRIKNDYNSKKGELYDYLTKSEDVINSMTSIEKTSYKALRDTILHELETANQFSTSVSKFVNKEFGYSRKNLVHENEYKMIAPIMHVLLKNDYINSYNIDQMMMGDNSFFKNAVDKNKRRQGATSPGLLGFVHRTAENEMSLGMRPQYNVAVVNDINFKENQYLESLLDSFGINEERKEALRKYFKDANFDISDGQGFMTPFRRSEIVKGFGDSYNAGYIMKPAHYEQDKDGVPRMIKYSSIVLTDDLIRHFPEFALLREEMLNKNVDELVFASAFKVGAPSNMSNIDYDYETGDVKNIEILENSIVPLMNSNYRLQLNPEHDIDSTTANPSQLTFFLNVLGDNTHAAQRVFGTLGKIISHKRSIFVNDYIDVNTGRFNAKHFLEAIINKSQSSETDNIASSLAGLAKGDASNRIMVKQNPLSWNSPSISDKVFTQFASMVESNVISNRFKGSKLILQSSIFANKLEKGKKRERLKYKNVNGAGIAEAYFPRGLFSKEQEEAIDAGKDLFLYSDALGFRIPSSALHSGVAIKVVGFHEMDTNTIIMPPELVVLHGSDFDVDSLYIIREEETIFKNKDISYEFGSLLDELQKEFDAQNLGEYFKTTSSKNTDNSSYWIGFTTNEEGKMKMNYEMEEGLLTIKTNILNTFNETYNSINENQNIDVDKKNKDLKRLEEILNNMILSYYNNIVTTTFKEVVTAERNNESMASPIEMETVKKSFTSYLKSNPFLDIGFKLDENLLAHKQKMHSSSMNGRDGTGILANAIKGFAYMHSGKKDSIIDVVYNEKDHIPYLLGTEPLNKLYDKDELWKALDSFLNAAIDNVKEQLLPQLNLNNETIPLFAMILGLGVPLQEASLIMLQPSLKIIADSKGKDENGINLGIGKTLTIINQKIADHPNKSKISLLKKYLTKENLQKTLSPEVWDNDGFTIHEIHDIELLQAQKELLTDLQSIAEKTAKFSNFVRYLGIIKSLPVFPNTVEEMYDIGQKLIQNTDGVYTINKDFPFKIDDFLQRNPHILENHKTLELLHDSLVNNWFKYDKDIQEMIENLELNIKLDVNKFANKKLILDEFVTFIYSSMDFSLDLIPDYTYRKGSSDKKLNKIQSFNQEFTDKIIFLQNIFPNNYFLSKFTILNNNYTELPYLRFMNTNKANDIEQSKMEGAFEELNKYTLTFLTEEEFEIYKDQNSEEDKNLYRYKKLSGRYLMVLPTNNLDHIKTKETLTAELETSKQETINKFKDNILDNEENNFILSKAKEILIFNNPSLNNTDSENIWLYNKELNRQVKNSKNYLKKNIGKDKNLKESQQQKLDILVEAHNIVNTFKAQNIKDLELQEDLKIKIFKQSSPYSETQLDFVTYSILNYGAKAGTFSFSQYLPDKITRDPYYQYENLMKFLQNKDLTGKKDNPSKVNMLNNITDLFKINLMLNFGDRLPEIKGKNKEYKNGLNYGVDYKNYSENHKNIDFDLFITTLNSTSLNPEFILNKTPSGRKEIYILVDTVVGKKDVVQYYKKVDTKRFRPYYDSININNHIKTITANDITAEIEKGTLDAEKNKDSYETIIDVYDLKAAFNETISIPVIEKLERNNAAGTITVSIHSPMYLSLKLDKIKVGDKITIYNPEDSIRKNFNYGVINKIDLENNKITLDLLDTEELKNIYITEVNTSEKDTLSFSSLVNSNKFLQYSKKSMTVKEIIDDTINNKTGDPLIREVFKLLNKNGLDNFLETENEKAGIKFITKKKFSKTRGSYNLQTNNIEIYVHPSFTDQNYELVFLHEVVHSATARLMKAPNSSLTSKQIEAKNRIKSLYKLALAHYGSKDEMYGLKNENEFIAEAFSNYEFQRELDKIMINKRSIWTRFMETIAKLFGVTKGSLLEDLLITSMELMSDGAINDNTAINSMENMILNSETDPKIKEFNRQKTLITSRDVNGNELDHYTHVNKPGIRFTRSTDPAIGLQIPFNSRITKLDPEFNSPENQLKRAKKNVQVLPDGSWYSAKDNTTYTSDQEYLDTRKYTSDQAKIRGKAVEAVLLYRLTGDPELLNTSQQLFAQLNKEVENKFSFLFSPENDSVVVDFLRLSSGVNVFDNIPEIKKDKILTQIPFVSEALKFGGTLDLMLQHSDNKYSIYDIKNSHLDYNENTLQQIFRFTADTKGGNALMYDARNKAKLQVMLYAVFAKLNNPEMQFRNLGLIHVPSNISSFNIEALLKNKKAKNTVNVHKLLSAFKQFLQNKDSISQNLGYQKGNETLWDLLDQEYRKNGGKSIEDLFEPSNYFDSVYDKENSKEPSEKDAVTVTDILTEIKQLSITEKSDDLFMNVQKRDDNNNMTKENWRKERLKELTTQYFKLTLDKDVQAIVNNKLSTILVYIGTGKDVDHPAFVPWNNLKNKRDLEFKERTREKTKKFDMLLARFTKEASLVTQVNYEEEFGKFFKVSKIESLNRNQERLILPTDEEWKSLSIDEQNILTYMNETFKSYFAKDAYLNTRAYALYNPVSGITESKTHLELYNKDNAPFAYYEGWFPKIPIGSKERQQMIIDKEGIIQGVKKIAKDYAKSELTSFYEEVYRENEDLKAIPLRYLDSEYLQDYQNRKYSRQMEAMFYSFVGQMEFKEQMDDVYHLGRSIILTLREDSEMFGEATYFDQKSRSFKNKNDNISTFINDRMDMELAKTGIKRSDYLPEWISNNKKVDPDKMLLFGSKWATGTVMHLRPFGAAGNAMVGNMFKYKEAIKNSILSMDKSFDSKYIDFTYSNMLWAEKEYITSYLKDLISGDMRKNKTYLLGQKFSYLSDHLYFGANNTRFRRGSRQAFSYNNLYILHTAGENYLSYTIMLAQLKHLTMNLDGKETSIYDLYDVMGYDKDFNLVPVEEATESEYTLVWKGPIRKIKEGQNIVEQAGLDYREIASLRAVSAHLLGDYRNNESNKLDMYAFTKVMFVLKRYLFRIFLNGFEEAHASSELGRYTEEYDETTGESYFEWQNRMVEGRWRTLARLFFKELPNIRQNVDKAGGFIKYYNSLEPHEKNNLIDALTTLGIFLTTYGIGALMFAGDDDDDTLKMLYTRYVIDNGTQQYNIKDLAMSAKELGVPILAKKLYDVVDSGFTVFSSGILWGMGDEQGAFTQKGDLRGLNTLIRSLPYVNIPSDFYRKFSNIKSIESIDSLTR